ncbi:hypothetical protein [Loigolactobacillus coryniformis]|uniref:Uncharacterized protein n=1 Tax=Loigolactobacillus coryniformis TaxID=1610 RepID=A0A5B8TGS6_9LACO|nr:hypothetical protein [Loigolactobacillus coryniformis]QEA53697.1 hypothetical protein FGL77_10665 [Loigolactobacillus coryniformis]
MLIQRLDIYQRETLKDGVSQGKDPYALSLYVPKLLSFWVNDVFSLHFGLDLAGDTYQTEKSYFYEFSKFGLTARYYFVNSPYTWEPKPPKIWAAGDAKLGCIKYYIVGPDIVNSGDLKWLGLNTGLTLGNTDLARLYKDNEAYSYPVDLKRQKLYFGNYGYYLTPATEKEKVTGKLPDLEKVFNPSTTLSRPDNDFHENYLTMTTNTRVKPHYQSNLNLSDMWGGFFGGVYLGGGFDSKDK